MKSWLSNRVNFIDTNFLNPPSLSSPGGLVSTGLSLSIADNSGKAGTTIYYTLDGTDPRASGGAVAPNALIYSGPITLTNNVRVMARCRDLRF